MKKTSMLVAAALGFGFALPAFAEPIDLGTATCGEIAALDGDTIGTLLMWMDGYTGGVAGDSTFDAERLKVNITDASAACDADPSRPLLEVMQEVVGQ